MADVGWQARIAAKAGWIASCHEIDVEWVQVGAKRDGIAACVHLHSVAGGREDLEWARLLSAVTVYQEIPRRLNGGQAFSPRTEAHVALEPSPSWTSAWGECEREIGRRTARCGAWYSYMLELYMYTVDSMSSTVRYVGPGVLERDDRQVRST